MTIALRGGMSIYEQGAREAFATALYTAATTISSTGRGLTITRTGVGLFTATLDKPYVSLLGFVATIREATPTDKITRLVTQTPSTGVLTFQTWDISGAAAAELANTDNIYVSIAVSRSGIARV